MTINLLATVQEIDRLAREIAAHEAVAKQKSERLGAALAEQRTLLARSDAGLDLDKIALAETVMYAGAYDRGGDERNVARQKAIKWFAGTLDSRNGYDDLRRVYFGTKNYDRWCGQEITCSYGMGPRHGSVCFKIGLVEKARTRDLTDDEREAAIYYLVNLEAIQKSKRTA